MPFVIIDTAGTPLRDGAGELIVLAAREEAARWTTKGERVEPYIPRDGMMATFPLLRAYQSTQTGRSRIALAVAQERSRA